MHAWEAIDNALSYIEENITVEIDTKNLSDIAGLSPFYFQRLFKRLVKKPVQEYIKLRRLAAAVKDLQRADNRIIDTAVYYGFSDHANFTRAFRETYQITPEEYKKRLPMLNVFDKPQLAADYAIADENVPLVFDTIVLEIQRRTIGQEIYYGFEAAVSIAEQIPAGESTGIDVPGELWREFHEKKPSVSDAFCGDVELGMCHTPNAQKGTFRYFAGGQAAASPILPHNGMAKQILPAGEYIICRVEAESFDELVTTALNQANRYLFENWLKNHGLRTKPFSAEKYYPAAEGINYMEIWVLPET